MKLFAVGCFVLVQAMVCFANEQSGAEMIEQSPAEARTNSNGFQHPGLTSDPVETSPSFEEQSRYPAMSDTSLTDGTATSDDNRQ